jgi:hypothetical protein
MEAMMRLAMMALALFVATCSEPDGTHWRASSDDPALAELLCMGDLFVTQMGCNGEYYDLINDYENLCADAADCLDDAEPLIDCVLDCYVCWQGDGPATYYGACMDACSAAHWSEVADCWDGPPLG